MIRSMTGFGAGHIESKSWTGTVTVRSLNHRFLDVTVHLPRHLEHVEPEVKRRVQRRAQRGRIELAIQTGPGQEAPASSVVATPIVPALVSALRDLQREHGLRGEVQISDVARFPGALEVEERPSELEEARRGDLLAAVDRALDALEDMRRTEGRALAEEIAAHLARIEAAVDRIEAGVEAGKEKQREVLLERLRELALELGRDETRLYQEVVRVVERHDVREELQRLRSHVAQARELLDRQDPCGKRLDFLAQEMAREAHTAGSKAPSAEVVGEVIALKSEIEGLREQVQNVE